MLLTFFLFGCNEESPLMTHEQTSREPVINQDGWNQTEALELLYGSAKSEGKVIYYTSNREAAQAYKSAFEEEYLGIDVEIRSFLTESLASTYLAERNSGRAEADVLSGSLMAMHPIVERNLLYRGADWQALGVEGDRVILEGRALMIRQGSYCICFDSSVIDIDELPPTLDGFRDPKWKDQLVASDFLFPAGLGYYSLQNGIEGAVDLGRYLIDEQGLLVTSQYQSMVVSGERPIAILGWAPSFINQERKGYPMGSALVDGLGVPLFVAALSDMAPHPNAAKLFTAFLTSKEASRASWESPAAAGWPAYGHGLHDLESRQRGQASLIFEGPLNFRQRASSAGIIREALFGQ
jgi:iron(III) transport system substrate-binding protein